MSSWHYKAGVVCQPEVTLGDAVEEVPRDDAALHQCRSEEKRWGSVWVKTTLSWAQISDFAQMMSLLLNQSGADSLEEGAQRWLNTKKTNKKNNPTVPLTVPHTCNCGVIYALSNIPGDNTCCH